MRLVVLDAAGTLLELARPVGETYAECAAQAGAVLDSAAVERAFADAHRAAPPLAFGDLPDPEHEAAERAWWRAVARRAVDAAAADARGEASGSAADLDFERFFDLAWARFARADAWRVPDDVRAALRSLRVAGVPLAVLSNWDRRLAPLLDELGLAGFFARILVSSALPAPKPAREAFEAGERELRRAGLAWRGAPIMVGDRIEHDVVPAIAASWDAIWLDRAGQVRDLPAGVRRIHSLAELAERARELAA